MVLGAGIPNEFQFVFAVSSSKKRKQSCFAELLYFFSSSFRTLFCYTKKRGQFPLLTWCSGRESNPHAHGARDFKSLVSTVPPPELIFNWRRHPDSNWSTRLCRPLRSHSAMAPFFAGFYR